MSPKLVIDAIENMVLAMPEMYDRDRWVNYGTIRVLASELVRWAVSRGDPPSGLVREKIVELLSGVEAQAGFSELHDAERGRDEALAAISRLRHPNLFGRSIES